MFGDVSKGDTVSVSYTSKRSGNLVSRNGTVLQTPNQNGKRGFFLQTDDDQLTGVMADRVYSITVGEENGERSVQRKTYVGDIEEVSLD